MSCKISIDPQMESLSFFCCLRTKVVVSFKWIKLNEKVSSCLFSRILDSTAFYECL